MIRFLINQSESYDVALWDYISVESWEGVQSVYKFEGFQLNIILLEDSKNRYQIKDEFFLRFPCGGTR